MIEPSASSPNIAICTIVAANYISFARVLAESFKKYNPGIRVFVLLVDKFTSQFDPDAEGFDLIKIEELPYPEIPSLLFKYNILEVCTAIKPFLLEYLFHKYGLKKIAYFDPDIMFYNPVSELWPLLDKYSILLTPHLTEPIPIDDKCKPTELEILRSGVYNLGFIALANNDTVLNFLSWWKERLERYCVREHSFLFVDQKWIDLAVGYYENIYILRDPGYNAAYWNLQSRKIRIDWEAVTVNGLPLKFFHFSGYVIEDPNSVSKYQDRYTLKNLKHLVPLFEGYKRRVLSAGYQQTKTLPYAFDHFDNGVKISEGIRKQYLGLDKEIKKFGNPFLTRGRRTFYSWLNEAAIINGRSIPVTNLWHNIYASRPDVQAAFPDIYNNVARRQAFLRWCISSGNKDHSIDEAFLDPIYHVLGITPAGKKDVHSPFVKSAIYSAYHYLENLVVKMLGNNKGMIHGLSLVKQGIRTMFRPF